MTAQDLAQVAPLFEALDQLVTAKVDAAVRRALAEKTTGPEPVWLSQVEAARRADVTPQTIRTWIKAGHLETGRKGRVSAESLRRHLATPTSSRRCAPPAPPAASALPPTQHSRARLQIASALSAGGTP